MEGETDDKGVNALRQRQMRNMHMALMLSQGTPMVLMGTSLPCPPCLLGLRVQFEHLLSLLLQHLGCHLSGIVRPSNSLHANCHAISNTVVSSLMTEISCSLHHCVPLPMGHILAAFHKIDSIVTGTPSGDLHHAGLEGVYGIVSCQISLPSQFVVGSCSADYGR